MTLVHTGNAIGEVTELLRSKLDLLLSNEYKLDIEVKLGRPEPPSKDAYIKKIVLFLYEAVFDPSLKNVTLQENSPEPLWLVLRFILTAFDDEGKSESKQAYNNLGQAVRALQQLNYLQLTTSGPEALQDNPEPLKITFNEASADLVSKLMQGGEERYRFSMAFEVRPVMIAFPEPPATSLLVGVDYTKSPYQTLEEEEKGVHIEVVPSMGPGITDVTPKVFEVDETVTISGWNLDQGNLSVYLGETQLEATAQQPEQMQFKVTAALAQSSVISAGSYPLRVAKLLASGRTRSGNIKVANLLPSIDSGQVKPGKALADHPYDTGKKVITADITLNGSLMGLKRDDILVCFYRDGKTTGFIEVEGPDPPNDQKKLDFKITADHKIPAGIYKLVLLVNGQQARFSPEMDLTAP